MIQADEVYSQSPSSLPSRAEQEQKQAGGIQGHQASAKHCEVQNPHILQQRGIVVQAEDVTHLIKLFGFKIPKKSSREEQIATCRKQIEQALTKLHGSDAEQFLLVLSFFNSRRIPDDCLEVWLKIHEKTGPNDIKKCVLDSKLLHWDQEQRVFQFNPIIHQVLCEKQIVVELCIDAYHLLRECIKSLSKNEFATWSVAKMWHSHAVAFTKTSLFPQLGGKEQGQILSFIGEASFIKGRITSSVNAHSKALSIHLNQVIGQHSRLWIVALEALPCHPEKVANHVQEVTDMDLALSLLALGKLYALLQKYDKAYKYCQAALTIFQKIPHLSGLNTAHTLGILGTILTSLEKPKEAESAYDQAIEKAKQYYAQPHIDDLPGNLVVAEIKQNLGLFYSTIDKTKEGIEHIEEAFFLYFRPCFSQPNPSLALSLLNQAIVYFNRAEREIAFSDLDKAEKMLKVLYPNDQHIHAIACLQCKGHFFYQEKKYKEALTIYKALLQLYTSIGLGQNNLHSLETLTYMGKLYFELKQFARAIETFQPAVDMAIAILQDEKHPSIVFLKAAHQSSIDAEAEQKKEQACAIS